MHRLSSHMELTFQSLTFIVIYRSCVETMLPMGLRQIGACVVFCLSGSLATPLPFSSSLEGSTDEEDQSNFASSLPTSYPFSVPQTTPAGPIHVGNWLPESGCELPGGEHAPHPRHNLLHPPRLLYHLWGNIHEPQAKGQRLLPFLLPLQNVRGPQGQNRRCKTL